MPPVFTRERKPFAVLIGHGAVHAFDFFVELASASVPEEIKVRHAGESGHPGESP